MNNIRNFCIIAHIDHGKSTLADRMLELTGTIEKRLMKAQYLDSLDLERERGITIKMAPVRMLWHPHRGTTRTDTRNVAESKLLHEDITYKVRGAVFNVRKNIGLGHKEIVYQKALAIEFEKSGLKFEREKVISVDYDGKKIGTYQPDFVIGDKVIIELKALPSFGRAEEEQLWSYLKGLPYKVALLINFGSRELEIKRIVYDTAPLPRDSASSPRESAEIEEYVLNLIDTPGHSDFGYEVSRALHAVEGAILLVDATQGIQAQTLANFETAKREGLKLIGAVNKIDAATDEQVAETRQDLAALLRVAGNDILKVSGKTGAGVLELVRAVIKNIPPPRASQVDDDRALIFDSLYDEHKGVLAFVRVFDGELETNDGLHLLATGTDIKAKEVGYLVPDFKRSDRIGTGETGYIATGIKDPDKIRIGDTVATRRGAAPLPGYKEPQPVVFVSFYPDESGDYDDLHRALQKLRLTDASLVFEPDMSEALGRGFKGGFLGRLHFEIVAERLAQEFGIQTVHSFPSVAYMVTLRNGEPKTITNPKDLPEDYVAIQEPVARLEIITPSEYLNSILRLREYFRFQDIVTASLGHKTKITMNLPLADLVSDLDDKLKSASQGYASLSYEILGYQAAKLEKMEILINNQVISGLTRIIPQSNAEREGRRTVAKLKELLPKLQYKQAIQAAIRGRIVAREDIAAMKKNVTGHLYGGDRTRKMKLWKKQQKGKERLKELGAKSPVRIPASIFKELLRK